MSTTETDRPGRLTSRVLSALALLAVWQLAAALTGDANTLPGPLAVFSAIGHEAASGELFVHIRATLMRVLAAFVLAMAIGITLGLILGRNRSADRALDLWVIFLLNLPALVVIVLCYIWIGLTEVAAIAAVTINKIPMVTVMIREGAKAFEPRFDDLAEIYRMRRMDRLRYILLPQLAPHLAAAARAGVALIWKIVLVVELLGRPNGVGFQIHLYFQLFDVRLILAYSISFVIVMLLIEFAILKPLETRANRWRFA